MNKAWTFKAPALAALLMLILAHNVALSSILPDTSAVMIDEADKEGTIGLKNTDARPVLLYAKVIRLKDDEIDGALVPVPAAVLVQPGETQIVRILFRSNKKLTQEHMARVVFTGIPPKDQDAGHVRFLIGHDLPIILRPMNQAPVEQRWRYLKWFTSGNELCVANDTKMVIRYVNNVSLLPTRSAVVLPKAYSLPASKNCGPLPEGFKKTADMKVQFSGISGYNYMLDDLQLPVATDGLSSLQEKSPVEIDVNTKGEKMDK